MDSTKPREFRPNSESALGCRDGFWSTDDGSDPRLSGGLRSYLFGSILAIPTSDLFWMVGIDCFILLLVLGRYKPLLAVSYDHEYAELTKVPVKWFYPLVLVLLACGVVILIRLVGIILVLALLTIPPSMLVKNAFSLQQLMTGSTLLCFAMCMIGLIISYYGDTNTSAAIVVVAIATNLTNSLL